MGGPGAHRRQASGFDDNRLLGLTPAIVPSGQHPLTLIGVGHPADPDE
ncbi:hypothetical protein [Streptomyces sp. NBC_00286]|nr:hypothetical protein [Streptomyces sp. NBC_00286]